MIEPAGAILVLACGLALPFNLILHSAAGQDLRLLDLICAALVPLALWFCLHRLNLLLTLLALGLLFVLPTLVQAIMLLDRQGDYRDFVFPFRFLLALSLCAAVTPLLESARNRAWFAAGLALGCCLNVVPLVFQSLGLHETMVTLGLAPSELVIPVWDIEQRPPGLHGHANATSAVVSLAIPVAAFMATRRRQWWLLPAAVVALLACSYFTETRSAVAVSLVTLGLALALWYRSDRLLLLLPSIALAALLTMGWVEGPLLPESFARLGTAGANLAERLTTIATGLRLAFEHPLGMGRTLGEAALHDLTGVRAIHNAIVWLGLSVGLVPAIFALVALLGASAQARSPGAAGLRGLLALHLLGLSLFEDHFQNQTFLGLLILLIGGWLVERLGGSRKHDRRFAAGAGEGRDMIPTRLATRSAA